MKDKQAKAPHPTGSIPVISPILHYFSMPILVILRHGFGYAFLSPKSVFLASIFATVLLSYIVWNEASLKPRFGVLSLFCLLASALYLIHLIRCIYKEARNSGKHDQYSGTSNLSAIISVNQRVRFEPLIHCIAEPLLIFTAGYLFSANALGKFLMVASSGLLFKELIRTWLGIRTKKRVADNMTDAEDMADIAIASQEAPLSSTGRTGRERFERDSS